MDASYDDAYRVTPDYFGTEPTAILRDYGRLIDRSGTVLDLGAGQGRNTFFLARQGYAVDAVDPSREGIDAIARTAAEERLPIRTRCTGFADFSPDSLPYAAILLFGLIQVLPRSDLDLLLEKVDDWTGSKSLVMISAFSTDDPSLSRDIDKLSRVGKNCYRLENGGYRTYLEPGEIVTLFDGYSVVHHWEGLGPVHRHGNKPPHRHGSITAVFRK